MNLSLRARLYWMLAALMGLILGVGTVALIYHSRISVQAEIVSSLTLARQLLSQSATDDDSLNAMLEHLAATRHLRLKGESTTVRAPAWFIWWVSPPAGKLTQQLGTRRLSIEADPGDEISEAWEETRFFFLCLLALATGSGLVIHLLLGRAFRPLPEILEALEGVKQGKYDVRLRIQDPPELRCLAEAFNHMAAALEKTWAENRRLTRRLLAIQENERRVLARELHDEIGQSLSALKALSRVNGDERMADICDRALVALQDLLQSLHPVALEDLGLTAALDILVEDFNHSHPQLVLHWQCDPLPVLPTEATIHLYRIVQESLHNITRHAYAREVCLSLKLHDQKLLLVVSDDGRGFDSDWVRRGLGLMGMAERAAEMGGALKLDTAPDRGCRIHVQVPL